MDSAKPESADSAARRISRRLFLGQSSALMAGAMSPAILSAQQLESILQPGPAYQPPASAKKIRLGVVGGGFGAAFFWHLVPNCVVQAVSDHRPERRQKLMEVYRCKTSYPSLEELVKDKSVDAVAIFTGAPMHVPHTELAMKAGKHVVSAVPACTSLEQAEQLRDVVKKYGLTYMMAETSWFQPESMAARELYKAGAFGELFYSEVEYNHPITEKDRQQQWYANGKRTWRYGMEPMRYPTHASAFLTGITGETLTDVSCLGVLQPKIEGYGVGANAYDNPYNAMMGLFSTSKGNVCRTNVIWTGTNHGERGQWFGTKLSLYMPNHTSGQPFHGQQENGPAGLELPDYRVRLPESLRIPSGHGGSHPYLCNEFITSLVESRAPAIGLHEALALTVPGLIAGQSARKGGERLKIPTIV
jgi:predicted dehydrogenase